MNIRNITLPEFVVPAYNIDEMTPAQAKRNSIMRLLVAGVRLYNRGMTTQTDFLKFGLQDVMEGYDAGVFSIEEVRQIVHCLTEDPDTKMKEEVA